METTAAIFQSFHCTIGSSACGQPPREKFGANSSHRLFFSRCLRSGSSFMPKSANQKSTSPWHVKSSVIPSLGVGISNDTITESSFHEPLKNKSLSRATFPNGFESLIMELCDETEIAELKLKVGDFEMHVKRNIESIKAPVSIVSPLTPPPVPSEPMIESVPVSPLIQPKKSTSSNNNPFKSFSLTGSAKLSVLEGSGSNAYVIISSPTVGSFRRGRTLKGKKLPPACKEGDIIKEGQVIGYLDQFGTELPVKSDVAGEVIKLLYKDGEAVGYGDPLVAVLPSFHGIR